MNTIPFPTFTTPRTPKAYRHAKEPTSPLAKYGLPPPPKLPSLQSWKDTCRSFSSSSSSSTNPRGMSIYSIRGGNYGVDIDVIDELDNDEDDYPMELIEAPVFTETCIRSKTVEENVYLGTRNVNGFGNGRGGLDERTLMFVRRKFRHVLAGSGVVKRKGEKKRGGM